MQRNRVWWVTTCQITTYKRTNCKSKTICSVITTNKFSPIFIFGYVIYADPTERLQENRPAIILEINTNKEHWRMPVMLWKMSLQCLMIVVKVSYRICLNFPRYGDEKNWIKENVTCILLPVWDRLKHYMKRQNSYYYRADCIKKQSKSAFNF